MSPNLSGGLVPSEALDKYLGQHGSHESLELNRDEKFDHFELFSPTQSAEQTSETVGRIPLTNIQAGSRKLSVHLIELPVGQIEPKVFPLPLLDISVEGNIREEVFNIPKSVQQSEATAPPLKPSEQFAAGSEKSVPGNVKIAQADSSSRFLMRTLGKSVSSSSLEAGNLAFYPAEADNKSVKEYSNSHISSSDPEETLIQHDPSVSRALKNQQGALLEKALKETESITREEEEWAIVEKQLAEDFSFARTVEELLQSADNSAKDIDNDASQPSYINIDNKATNIREASDLVTSGKQIFPETLFRMSSGSPPTISPSSQFFTTERINYQIQTQSSETNFQSSSRPDKISLPPHSTQISSDTSYFIDTSATQRRTHQEDEQYLSTRRSNLGSETTSKPENSNLDKRISEDSRRPAHEIVSPLESVQSRASKSNSRSARRSTTQKAVSSSTESAPEFSEPIPTGILHIPGHAPESPADLNLVHHDLSVRFLKGQGARVLNPEPAMTAQGATAVILSCICLLFLTLIGIAFFVQKQRKQRLIAKLAADIEGQRQKRLTSNDGLFSYKLQPAPVATLRTTPVITEKKQPQSSTTSSYTITSHPHLNEVPLTHKPPRKPSHDVNRNKMAEESDAFNMAEKISRKSKMAASCSSSEKSNMAAFASNSSLPSYDEVQSVVHHEVCITSSSSSSSGGSNGGSRGKLWFSVAFDAVQEALLLHVQQARYSQVRAANRVWVEACVLTNRNDVHTVARTEVTTATQNPVFNSRIAFQIEIAHLEQLLLRLTLYTSKSVEDEDTALGSVIVPLHSTDLTTRRTLIRDLN